MAEQVITNDAIKQLAKAIIEEQRQTPLVHTVPETARLLKTAVNNVYSLIRLGLLKPMQLGDLSISDEQLKQFMREYEGKDLKQTIKDEQENYKKRKKMTS